LAALIAAAPTLGAPVLSLCTGSRDDHMWTRHRDNATAEAWADMAAEVAAAAELAEQAGVVLGIECEYSNVVSSARQGRRLLDELGTPAVKIVLDAANLVPPGQHRRQRALLEEAFELLGDDIAVAHAKDITTDGTFVAAGTGVLDYELFLRLLLGSGFTGPLVLHSLSEADIPSALAAVQGHGDSSATSN
jgi:sugar phosphate isomerase/epimerase